MNRCTLASITHALPAWLLVGLLAVVSAAAFVVACGGSSSGSSPTPTASVTVTSTPSASPSPTTTPPSTSTLSLYFLRGEQLGVAERLVPHTTRPATAAMEALLAGPTAAERAAGLTTAVPDGTRLIGVRISDGVATVDLSGALASGGGSLSMQARVAQIVYTLTRFPTVKAVDFRLDGSIVETLGGEGLILDAGQTRADWRDLEPAIFVERPGVGAVLSSPFILEGTASVFEGSFTARLADAGGDRVASATVQASRGAPGRGRYRQTVPFETTAARGVLIVYSQSMEDGSRQSEVRIPVTFSPQ